MGKVGIAVVFLAACVLLALAGGASAQGPACPTSWPEADHEDFFTDSDGRSWFIIRSADSNGYETVRAYPASEQYDVGYVPNSPDETCHLLVRRPGNDADLAQPKQMVFPREREEEPPSATTPAVPAGGITVVPGARWGDLFVDFTEAERSCITGSLGEELLAVAVDTPIHRPGDLREWEVTIFGCLSQDTAITLFLSIFFAHLGVTTELPDEATACMRDVLADADIPTLVGALGPNPSATQAEALLAFFFGMATCGTPATGIGPGGSPGDDETRLWSFSTGGWVAVAPAVIDGVVYVGSADQHVYALDAVDGSELWSFATGDAVNSTPAVTDGVVYVGSNDNHLYALDATTGNMLWSHDAGAWVQYSPTVSGGVVYATAVVGGEPRVVALDASTGALVWTAGDSHRSDPKFAPTLVGQSVYVPGAEFGVFRALDASTGEIAWTASVGSYVESAPTVIDDVVYLTVVNEAYALDEATGEIIWRYGTNRFPAQDFPALVVNGVYYLSPDEFIHALDATTGELLWNYQTSGFISSAPVVADGSLFVATETGVIVALDATTGAELWTLTAEGRGLQNLTVADNVLYFESDEGFLSAVSASDGAHIRDFQKGYIMGVRTYTIHDGVVYFGSLPSGVHAYAAPRAP